MPRGETAQTQYRASRSVESLRRRTDATPRVTCRRVRAVVESRRGRTDAAPRVTDRRASRSARSNRRRTDAAPRVTGRRDVQTNKADAVFTVVRKNGGVPPEFPSRGVSPFVSTFQAAPGILASVFAFAARSFASPRGWRPVSRPDSLVLLWVCLVSVGSLVRIARLGRHPAGSTDFVDVARRQRCRQRGGAHSLARSLRSPSLTRSAPRPCSHPCSHRLRRTRRHRLVARAMQAREHVLTSTSPQKGGVPPCGH